MRKVIIASVQDGSTIEVSSSARTLSGLKEEYPEIKIKGLNSNAFLKNTKKDITDTDVLPDEDVIIYMYVDKTRSGDETSRVQAVIDTLSEEEKKEAFEILEAIHSIVEEVVEANY